MQGEAGGWDWVAGKKLACSNLQRGLPGTSILRGEKAVQGEETTGAKQRRGIHIVEKRKLITIF